MGDTVKSTISKLEADNQRLESYLTQMRECITNIKNAKTSNCYEFDFDEFGEWFGNAAACFDWEIDKYLDILDYIYKFYSYLGRYQKDAIYEYNLAETESSRLINSLDI